MSMSFIRERVAERKAKIAKLLKQYWRNENVMTIQLDNAFDDYQPVLTIAEEGYFLDGDSLPQSVSNKLDRVALEKGDIREFGALLYDATGFRDFTRGTFDFVRAHFRLVAA